MFVRTWMTREVETAEPGETLGSAVVRMRKGRFRRLPVVEDGEVVGILTLAEAERALDKKSGKIPLSGTMSRDVEMAVLDEPVEEVAARMRQKKIGAFPVVQGGKLAGIITESDIFQAFMNVMGVGKEGARITFDLRKGPDDIFAILRLAARDNLEVMSIATYDHPDTDRKLVTLRLRGEATRAFVKLLWSRNFRLSRVLLDGKTVRPPE